jgi:hypothetical protein
MMNRRETFIGFKVTDRMNIKNWLNGLSQVDSRSTANDIHYLSTYKYPFLSQEQVNNHINCLSSHLGSLEDRIRRLAITYSLYTRQLDVIQEMMSKQICGSECERPPAGCCNSNHYIVFSMSDLMIARPSSLALELSEIISHMQKNENAYYFKGGGERTNGYCGYLTSTGCTLKLFKSPLCIHYLCSTIHSRMHQRFGDASSSFLKEMKKMSLQSIATSSDFTSLNVIAAALLIFPDL